MSAPVLLVVGAREGSLGEQIVFSAVKSRRFGAITTAGIHEEDMHMDITDHAPIQDVLSLVSPDYVVCTAGVNMLDPITSRSLSFSMMSSFETNVVGPIRLLQYFANEQRVRLHVPKLVAISSNSARIARTGSTAYCASKAALSMALRCAARELARTNNGTLVWGYEPGLLNTAMTREMFPPGDDPEHPGVPVSGPMHRMEGVPWQGLNASHLAERIVEDLLSKNSEGLNGCMIPYDAGEQ